MHSWIWTNYSIWRCEAINSKRYRTRRSKWVVFFCSCMLILLKCSFRSLPNGKAISFAIYYARTTQHIRMRIRNLAPFSHPYSGKCTVHASVEFDGTMVFVWHFADLLWLFAFFSYSIIYALNTYAKRQWRRKNSLYYIFSLLQNTEQESKM